MRICEPTRTEILYSARNSAHRDELVEELYSLFGEVVVVAKDGWRRVDAIQYRLTQQSQHRSAGPIDLLVCATAVHHGMTVLHHDDDFVTAAKLLPDLSERSVHDFGPEV